MTNIAYLSKNETEANKLSRAIKTIQNVYHNFHDKFWIMKIITIDIRYLLVFCMKFKISLSNSAIQ
jgi:hypothetical protein